MTDVREFFRKKVEEMDEMLKSPNMATVARQKMMERYVSEMLAYLNDSPKPAKVKKNADTTGNQVLQVQSKTGPGKVVL